MAKLHELLAVQGSLRTQAEATRNDLVNTFEKKRAHFSEIVKTFKSLKENVDDKVEEKLGLQTTIAKELEWISEKLAKSIDSAHQVDVANTIARADVVLDDGTVLLKDIPATSLLQLEKRIDEVRTLVAAIPTLDPTKAFEPDSARGDGIYKARDTEKPRTEKTFEYVVMVAPTEKHPAQVKELNTDKPIGTIIQQEWSSLITVADKGDMLDRAESLGRAIKRALSRANDQEVNQKENKIAASLLDFVFGK